MSFESRERKRQAKYRSTMAVAAARARHTRETAARCWLVLVKHDCRCAACGRHLRRGGEMVYRAAGHVKLCVACADVDPLVEYRPSAAWEARKVTEIARRAEKSRKAAAKTRGSAKVGTFSIDNIEKHAPNSMNAFRATE